VKGSTAGGPYLWSEYLRGLKDAVSVFGRGQVSTHLIVGLGEKDNELLGMIQKMIDMGVYPSLFAFTPIPGSKFEKAPRPSLERYRRIQLAQHLLTRRMGRVEEMTFDSSGNLISFGMDEEYLLKIIETGRPFMTSGCPGCNRPYYNERPGGEIYNYPTQVGTKDAEEIAHHMFRRKKDD
jgi:biotin synthase